MRTQSLTLPAFQNMRAGLPFSAYLLQEPLIAPLTEGLSRIDTTWASQLGRQISQIEERSRRLYFKSMGTILAHQEIIAQNYRIRILGESPAA